MSNEHDENAKQEGQLSGDIAELVKQEKDETLAWAKRIDYSFLK